MDIREALTDAYLARFFDAGALARGADVVPGVLEVSVVHEGASSLTATAHVAGTSPDPYFVQFHAEVTDSTDWVFNSCTCPVGRLCKHGAAVALLLRVAIAPTPPPRWRQLLEGVARETTARATASMTGAPLGLEISRRPASRWSRGEAGDFALRPVRLGARKRWVRTGAEWRDLVSPAATTRFIPTQLEAMRAIQRALMIGQGYYVPGAPTPLDDVGERLVPLLRDAVGAGVTLVAGDGLQGVSLSAGPLSLGSDLTTAEDGSLVLDVALVHDGQRWGHSRITPVGRPITSVVHFHQDHATLADLAAPVRDAEAALLLGPPLVADAADHDDFLAALTAIAGPLALASSDGSVILPDPPTPALLLTATWRSAAAVDLAWTWRYGEAACPMGAADPLGGLRDPAREAEIRAEVPAHLLSAASLSDGDALVFALHDLPHLRSLDDVEVVETDAPDFRASDATPDIEFALSDDQPEHTDWLDLEVVVAVEGELVPLPDVLAAITRGEDFLVLRSGLYVSLDQPAFARLHQAVEAAAQLRDRRDNTISVGTHDLGVWAELAEVGVVDDQAAQWVERAQALRDLTEIPRPDPVGLTTTLRPYQLEGFWWLAFLHQHGLGGVLADDMGLGKTLQVLALIHHTRDQGSELPFLVVAPTSVVTAWRQQAATHSPGLRVGVVSRRTDDVDAIVASHDIVLTTYALLRLERDAFARHHFGGLVLDEAQQVKNHQSKTYAAARHIEADFRLAVTGTPFENRLMELWALLSITAPGLYPSARNFRELVVNPVEKDGDDLALERFRTRIRPFVLRRTKEIVAADLPPKQEQVLEVDLAPRHRKIYDTHHTRARQEVLGLLDDFDRNRVAIFSALTRLRQLALDPALVDPDHDHVGSAKLELLTDHLSEITAEGHRALVFSQFTSFLGRVRDRLTAEGIPTVYLDGSTRDRETVIEAFRRGEAPVFLISLKAGGVGLTLTEADYVYVLDPWWNPAAEAQAVDRAHRIGQQQHVHVFRLVASDTIEDKVMALKARKAALFAKVIDGGGASSKGITAADIRGLFD
jgi:superfamily II DNA or RNA helicase